MLGRVKRLYAKFIVQRAKNNGLKIADDCKIMGIPFFGSEPYLISIGKHVTISSNVTFITHDGGTWVFRHKERYNQVRKFGRIDIKDNCFIGLGSIIMPGVKIGPNSVVGAGSVVTKDVPPNTVVVGSPARPIMSTDEYAEKCLETTPEYDTELMKTDKVKAVLDIHPYIED